MPTPPYSDPLTAMFNRFIEDIVFPRMEEAFDNIADNIRKPPKPRRIPKSGPHKAKRVHKAQPQRKAQAPRPNPLHKTHTYYDFYQVQPTVSPDVLAAVHRALVKKHHPDQFPTGSEAWKKATANMQVINMAWEVLGDAGKRAAYDKRIGVK